MSDILSLSQGSAVCKLGFDKMWLIPLSYLQSDLDSDVIVMSERGLAIEYKMDVQYPSQRMFGLFLQAAAAV